MGDNHHNQKRSQIFEQRRENLRAILAEAGAQHNGIDAFLVRNEANVSYLTGFLGDSSALVITADREVIVSDGRYTDQIAEECPNLDFRLRALGDTLNRTLAELIRSWDIRNLAIEAGSMLVGEYLGYRELIPQTRLVAVNGWVERLRAIKDDGEIAAIRQAIAVAERAFTMFRAGLRPDESEKVGADLMEQYLRRCGARCSSFAPIIAAGRQAALPHARPRVNARLDEGEALLIDWGADLHPYKSDLTRMLILGDVSPVLESVYQTVLAAQLAAIAAIAPGVPCREIDARARAVITDAGYGPQFTHALGHGIGMVVHEEPGLRMESPTVLQPGMIVTVEPGIYLPDWGGVRIEDDVLVTPTGCEVLSSLPKSLDDARWS